jgi:putative endonuclease
LKEHNFYTGYTNNLKKRIEEHNDGEVESTKSRTWLQQVYREDCICKKDTKLTTGDIINRAA